MTKKRLFLVLVASILISISNACEYPEYKDIRCEDEKKNIFKHTMCAYTADVKCHKFGFEVLKVGLEPEEKKTILDVHNLLRLNFSLGYEKRGNPGPQAAAKFMETLTWDNELEKIAQHWANQCDYHHDKCRNTAKYNVGQNVQRLDVLHIYENGTFPTSNDSSPANLSMLKVEVMVRNWYNNGVILWNRSDTYKPIKNFNKFELNVKHFTQLIWAKTKTIGCGAIRYGNGRYNKSLILICNYGPAGNVPGKRVYFPVDNHEEEEQISVPVPTGATNITTIIDEHLNDTVNIRVDYILNNASRSLITTLPRGTDIVSTKNEEKIEVKTDVVVKYYSPFEE